MKVIVEVEGRMVTAAYSDGLCAVWVVDHDAEAVGGNGLHCLIPDKLIHAPLGMGDWQRVQGRAD